MKKISFLMLLIFLVNNFCHCSKPDSWRGTTSIKNGVIYVTNPGQGLWKNSKKITFKTILSIGIDNGDENYILSDPKDLVVDNQGNIYICDFRDHSVKVYNKEGIFLRRIGKKGAGPGELYTPSSIALKSSKEIYIYDEMQNRINVFSLEGHFLKSFQTEYKIINITSNACGDIIFSTIGSIYFSSSKSNASGKNYYVINSNGKFISSFGSPIMLGDEHKSSQMSLSFINFSNSKIISTFQFPYRIEMYNTDYKLLKVITREADFFTPPELMNGIQYYVSRGLLGKPFFLKDGTLLVGTYDQGTNYMDHYVNNDISAWDDDREYYDLFDEEGRFLESFLIEFEKLGSLLYVDSQGYIYTNKTEPYPMILKYEILFEEK